MLRSSTSRRPVVRRGTKALVGLLAVATASATFFQGALAVLAADVIAALDMSRSQLGIAFAVFAATGGVLAPLLGRLADRSVVLMLMSLFGFSAAGLMAAAAAGSFAWILLAAVLGGLALGSGNPVTNKLVLQGVSERARGLSVGIKQAGPPLGLFTAGLILPPLAALVGWRWALTLSALVPLAALAATRWLVAEEPKAVELAETEEELPHPAPSAAGWLTVIGFAIATGAGAIIGFLPLYAIQELGFSAAVAGSLASLVGLVGIAARIGWGAAAPHFRHPIVPLLGLAAASLVASLLLLASGWVPPLIWVAAIAAGGSMLGWHSVAWLALLSAVDETAVGRSTGWVQVGSSAGFAAGPPLVGLTIDVTDSYAAAWTVVAAVFAVALALTVVWRSTNHDSRAA